MFRIIPERTWIFSKDRVDVEFTDFDGATKIAKCVLRDGQFISRGIDVQVETFRCQPTLVDRAKAKEIFAEARRALSLQSEAAS